MYTSFVMRKPALCHKRTTKALISLRMHPRRLISAFVVRCLDSIIPLLARPKISRLQLISVAEQPTLSLTWFPRDVAHMFLFYEWLHHEFIIILI